MRYMHLSPARDGAIALLDAAHADAADMGRDRPVRDVGGFGEMLEKA